MGFASCFFGEQAWKPKIPLLHTTVKHFPCGFTRTSRWFPVYPVVAFWLQWPHPQALQEGKAPNGTALQKVIPLVRCCRTGSLNYLVILVLISWWTKGYHHGICNSMATQMEFGCQAFSPYLAKIQKNVVFDFVKSIINYLVLYFLKWKYLSTSSFS